jgi:hypothetical protein
MRHQFVDLFEGAGIEQEIDALPCRELARLMLAREALLTPAELGQPLELGQPVS